MPLLAKISGTEMIIAAARKRNAAAGDTAVHKMPATALAARFAPACDGGQQPERRTAQADRGQRSYGC